MVEAAAERRSEWHVNLSWSKADSSMSKNQQRGEWHADLSWSTADSSGSKKQQGVEANGMRICRDRRQTRRG